MLASSGVSAVAPGFLKSSGARDLLSILYIFTFIILE